MPPRYAYWTLLVDGQPTAFRSGSLEDLMPTFNRLKEKQPTAELKWFQNGQLWASRHDAQDFMRARGDRGRERDPRQSSNDAPGARPERAWNAKPEWKTRTSFSPRSSSPKPQAPRRPSNDKPEWTPKGDKPEWKPRSKDAVPEGRSSTARRDEKPEWTPKSGKPEWKPKGTFKPKEPGHSTGWGEKPGFKSKGSPREQARASFRPKSYTPKGDDGSTSRSRQGDKPAWKPKGDKLEWKPASTRASTRQAPEGRGDGPNAGFTQSDSGEAPAKRKWVPKAEYKKSLGIEAKRDDKWRPGGEHKDPKQKYKDAKKAKWTRVKQTIRARSGKPRKRDDDK